MDENTNFLRFDYDRRMGIELELLSFDKRNFKKHPLSKNELPQGIEDLACVIADTSKKEVSVNKWHLTHNNDAWVLKPDSSCGIEICSPVLKGWAGLKHILLNVNALRKHPKAMVDDRCGFHVHLDVSDIGLDVVCKVLAYWIKCEAVFLDSVSESRKCNRYCQSIGSAFFMSPDVWHGEKLLALVGESKYYTLNAYHLRRGNRSTIEFRIMEGLGCLDPFLIKNWVRLLVHFVECAIKLPSIKSYNPEDKWTGYSWLDPVDVFKILRFDEPLSPGLTETRNWFLSRLKHNITCNLIGQFSVEARKPAALQVDELIAKYNLSQEDLNRLLRPSDQEQKMCPEKNKT